MESEPPPPFSVLTHASVTSSGHTGRATVRRSPQLGRFGDVRRPRALPRVGSRDAGAGALAGGRAGETDPRAAAGGTEGCCGLGERRRNPWHVSGTGVVLRELHHRRRRHRPHGCPALLHQRASIARSGATPLPQIPRRPLCTGPERPPREPASPTASPWCAALPRLWGLRCLNTTPGAR